MNQKAITRKPGWSARLACLSAIGAAAALVIIAPFLALRSLNPHGGGLQWEQLFPVLSCGAALAVVFVLMTFVAMMLFRENRILWRRGEESGRLATVANKTDHAVFLCNAEGAIEWVNEGFARVSGHLPGDVLGRQPGGILLGPLQNINVTQKIRDGIAQQKIFTLEMLCAHRRGHRYWLSLNMTPVFNEQKELANFIGVGSDITARKRAEEEVARIARRSELFLNAAGDGIFGLDLQGAITFVNTAAARLTGWPVPDLI